MSSSDSSHLKNLMSSERAGALYAPFRSRTSNVDGFDSKMKLWISAIEEMLISKNQLTFSLNDLQRSFISDNGLKPDKECLRLVMSEMKRMSLIENPKNLHLYDAQDNYFQSYIDQIVDPNGWLGWGLKTLVMKPGTWVYSVVAESTKKGREYSDLMDKTIHDQDRFICLKPISIISEKLLVELKRICRAEEQACFEWKNLFELLETILPTIIVAETTSEQIFNYELLISFLVSNKSVCVSIEDDTRFIKITSCDTSLYPLYDSQRINKADKAMAMLKKHRESLIFDSERLRQEAESRKNEAYDCYQSYKLSQSDAAKAKALRILRCQQELLERAKVRENILIKVESAIKTLKDAGSTKSTFDGLKAWSEAMKEINSQYVDIMGEVRDIAEENDQTLGVIKPNNQKKNADTSLVDPDAEDTFHLDDEEYLKELERDYGMELPHTANQSSKTTDESLKLLDERLESLNICKGHIGLDEQVRQSSPLKRKLKQVVQS